MPHKNHDFNCIQEIGGELVCKYDVLGKSKPISARSFVGLRIWVADGGHGIVSKIAPTSYPDDPRFEVMSEGGGSWLPGLSKTVSLSKIVRSEEIKKPKTKEKFIAGISTLSPIFWQGIYTYEVEGGKPFIKSYSSSIVDPVIIVDQWPVLRQMSDPYGPRGDAASGSQVHRSGPGEYQHRESRTTFIISTTAQSTKRTEIPVPEPHGKAPHRWRDGRWEKFTSGTWKNVI